MAMAGLQKPTEPYTYSAAPRPVNHRKFGKFSEPAYLYSGPMNIMYDPRVIRGNTYALQVNPFLWQEEAAAAAAKRKKKKRKRPPEKKRPETPEPVFGRKHIVLQTDKYLEELSDKIPEATAETQTDPFMDRPLTPLYIPQKTGLDVATQIEEGDLFHFDIEVEPILEVLVGKTLEQALMEVLEEEELAAMHAHQEHFEQIRNAELVAVQRMEAAEIRKLEEKERRIAQEKQRLIHEKIAKEKLAAQTFSRGYLSVIFDNVFRKLRQSGHFYDPVEREVKNSIEIYNQKHVEAERRKAEYLAEKRKKAEEEARLKAEAEAKAQVVREKKVKLLATMIENGTVSEEEREKLLEDLEENKRLLQEVSKDAVKLDALLYDRLMEQGTITEEMVEEIEAAEKARIETERKGKILRSILERSLIREKDKNKLMAEIEENEENAEILNDEAAVNVLLFDMLLEQEYITQETVAETEKLVAEEEAKAKAERERKGRILLSLLERGVAQEKDKKRMLKKIKKDEERASILKDVPALNALLFDMMLEKGSITQEMVAETEALFEAAEKAKAEKEHKGKLLHSLLERNLAKETDKAQLLAEIKEDKKRASILKDETALNALLFDMLLAKKLITPAMVGATEEMWAAAKAKVEWERKSKLLRSMLERNVIKETDSAPLLAQIKEDKQHANTLTDETALDALLFDMLSEKQLITPATIAATEEFWAAEKVKAEREHKGKLLQSMLERTLVKETDKDQLLAEIKEDKKHANILKDETALNALLFDMLLEKKHITPEMVAATEELLAPPPEPPQEPPPPPPGYMT
ncbi:hypothetical protein CBR_g17054 [Chara braunii]|uniref:Uncharacterized protein n=1 Tax=Chara braunii TaxID=69332 RepID=A0A388KUT9_CHABU|nr:hypothetical protein CBR_g17054 [Chara braunii]|eukprot:GBG73713.1 hypothetical protein CBR_g17054 [Chara braunii]